MATYTVKDPQTGKSVTLTGDSPPTEQELEDIFTKIKEPQESAPEQPTQEEPSSSYWQDVRKNAGKQFKEIAASAPATLKQSMALSKPLTGEIPTLEDIRTSGEFVKGIPNTLVQSLVDTVNTVRHPIISLREAPITTAMTGASFLAPLAKGAMAIRGGASAATEVPSSVTGTLAKRAYAKATNVALGTPEEAVLTRMENPNAVRTAFSHAELADQMVQSIKNFGDILKDLTNNAMNTLRSSPYIEEGAVPKTQVLDAVKAARREVGGAYTPDTKSAFKAMKDIEQTYSQKLKSTVSESQIKDRIRELDANINWDNPAASKANKALIGLRKRLDGILKNQNPDYAEAMKPVDEATRVINKVQDTFGIKHETGRGFTATDQTIGKIQRALKEDKAGTQAILKRFESVSGEDWTTKIRNANAKAAFERPGRGMGSTRSNVGAVAGEAVGNALNLTPLLGATLGTVGGAFSDLYGPRVAARLTDALAKPAMGRYVSILEKAAAKSARNLAVTHSLLMETDDKYASAMNGRSVSKSPASAR